MGDYSFSRSKYFHLLLAPIKYFHLLLAPIKDRKIDVTAIQSLLVQNRQQTHDWTLIGSGATGLDKLVWGEETKRLLNGHCMQLNWALYFLKIKIWNSKLLQNCWNLSRFSDVFKQHKNLQSKKKLTDAYYSKYTCDILVEPEQDTAVT